MNLLASCVVLLNPGKCSVDAANARPLVIISSFFYACKVMGVSIVTAAPLRIALVGQLANIALGFLRAAIEPIAMGVLVKMKEE